MRGRNGRVKLGELTLNEMVHHPVLMQELPDSMLVVRVIAR
jgi:hypothetical protein